MKKNRKNSHVFEIVLVLLVFLLVSLGSAFTKTDEKAFFAKDFASVTTSIFQSK